MNKEGLSRVSFKWREESDLIFLVNYLHGVKGFVGEGFGFSRDVVLGLRHKLRLSNIVDLRRFDRGLFLTTRKDFVAHLRYLGARHNRLGCLISVFFNVLLFMVELCFGIFGIFGWCWWLCNIVVMGRVCLDCLA